MTVGFDRFVRRAWLDDALTLALSGATVDDARARLDERLKAEVTGDTSRAKTVRRLAQIWVDPRSGLNALRDAGLHFARQRDHDRRALHWGMCMATYPFFASVVATIGRQLRLQEHCTTSALHRRTREAYGERATVKRATERVLQSITDWEMLARREEGTYTFSHTIGVDAGLSAWMVAALLHAKQVTSRPVDAVGQDPAVFPFTLSPFGPDDISARQLELVRQGGGRDIAVLGTP